MTAIPMNFEGVAFSSVTMEVRPPRDKRVLRGWGESATNEAWPLMVFRGEQTPMQLTTSQWRDAVELLLKVRLPETPVPKGDELAPLVPDFTGP